MLAAISEREGEHWVAVECSALAFLEAQETGVLKTKYAGEIDLNNGAMRQSLDSPIVWDFVLKRVDGCAIRYVRWFYSDTFRWA